MHPVLLTLSLLAAQMDDDVESTIRKLVVEFNQAYETNDLDKYFSYYADDVTQWFESGRVSLEDYKESWYGLIEAGGGVESNELDDIQVQVGPDGKTAVATYSLTVVTRYPDGERRTAQAWETDVWFLRDGKWQVAHLHYNSREESLSTLEQEASEAREVFARGWAELDALPPRSARDEAQQSRGQGLVADMADLCALVCRAHRREIYDRLTDGGTVSVRVDDLVWRAAELWPGLVPARDELAKEAERMQADKDGREIQQGIFVSEMLSDPEIGSHLVTSMLEPTTTAKRRLSELEDRGSVDLGAARVEVHGEVGYVFMSNPRYLNAEDDETLGPLEAAIDLALLHPDVKMGVLRGEPVEHPKYKDRRIFSAGINLTKIYHGKVSYLFYLVRDLGLVNKLYRGLAREPYRANGPETTLEKPWMAVVEAFAIGGGCQLLLVVDYVIAEAGAYFNLPARKEGHHPRRREPASSALRGRGRRAGRDHVRPPVPRRVSGGEGHHQRSPPARGAGPCRGGGGHERGGVRHGERGRQSQSDSGASGTVRHFPALHGDLRLRAGLLPLERAAHRQSRAPLER